MVFDLLGTVKQLIQCGFSVMAALEKAGHNEEDCRWIRELLRRLGAMAERLQSTPAAVADGLVADTAEGLQEALRRATKLITKSQRKHLVIRAWKAAGVADKLRGVCLDVLLNLGALLLAHGIYSNAEMKEAVAQNGAEMKEGFAQLRADLTCNNHLLAALLRIVVTHPDVHLPQEVAKLVQDYHESTQSARSRNKKKGKKEETDIAGCHDKKKRDSERTDIASSRNKNKRETKKTDIVIVGSQNKNKRETKKADVARLDDKMQNLRLEDKMKKNNRIRNKKVAPDAESASVENVTRQHGSSTIINKIMSISTKDMTLVTSIDVHPNKTWIVTGHEGGNFSIWDYRKQKTVMELKVKEPPGKAAQVCHEISQYFNESSASHSVCSVKFIARNKWLVVGDGDGYIHIYDYTNTKLVEKFRAHHKSVDSLAVHPTEPYLLSSSAFGGKIRLWNWSKDWVQIQRYDPKPTYPEGVRSLKFNPRDTNTFACVLYDNRVKVGTIETSRLKTTPVESSKAEYFFSHDNQQLMAALSTSRKVKIHDLETGKVVRSLRVSGRKMSHFAFNPKLEKLATMLDDGTVCLWDANNYRLEEMVHIADSKPRDLIFVTDRNGLTRLIVTFKTTIEIMEVKFK